MRATSAPTSAGVSASAVDAVFISPLYAHCPLASREGRSVLDELCEGFEAAGVRVVHTRAEAGAVVVALFPNIFDHDDLVREWMELLMSGGTSTDDVGQPLPMTYLIPLFATAWSFAAYYASCPEGLRELGLFAPLFQKWPNGADLQRAAVAFAVTHRVPLPRPALPLITLQQQQGEQHRSYRSRMSRFSRMSRCSRMSRMHTAGNEAQRPTLWKKFLRPHRRSLAGMLPEVTCEAGRAPLGELREERTVEATSQI